MSTPTPNTTPNNGSVDGWPISQTVKDIGVRFRSDLGLIIETPSNRGLVAVGLSIGVFLIWMIPLLTTDHDNFGTQNFDIGIFDQATYQLSNFDHFMTTRGLNVFGHHLNIGLYFFVPLYWIGLGGVDTLNIAAAISLAIAAIPVYMIGMRQTKNVWVAAAIAVAYLMNFSVSAMVNEGFHPEKMAVPALFLAIYFAMEQRWRLFVSSVAYAIIWKEDISLFIIMLGVYVFFAQSRKIGLWTSITGAVYFLLATQIILPKYNDADETFYGSQYGELGNGATEVAANALIFKQDYALELLQRNDAVGYLFAIGQPFGMLSYLSPHWLFLSLPHFAVNLLNIHGLAANPEAHYVAIPLIATTLAVIASMTRIRASGLRYTLCIWMLVAGTISMVSQGFTPISNNYESGVWQIYDNQRSEDLRGALVHVPDDAVVMATYDLIPHMSHRSHIYMYPNPYKIEYWGIGDAKTDDPENLEYVALNRASIGEDNPLHLAFDTSDSFELLYSAGDVVVFKRTAPGL